MWRLVLTCHPKGRADGIKAKGLASEDGRPFGIGDTRCQWSGRLVGAVVIVTIVE